MVIVWFEVCDEWSMVISYVHFEIICLLVVNFYDWESCYWIDCLYAFDDWDRIVSSLEELTCNLWLERFIAMLRSVWINKKLNLKFVSNSNERVYDVKVINKAFVCGFVIKVPIFRMNVFNGSQRIHLEIGIDLLWLEELTSGFWITSMMLPYPKNISMMLCKKNIH